MDIIEMTIITEIANENIRDIVLKAYRKQIPLNPNDYSCCPNCDTYLKDDNGVEGEYCPNCGQKINWCNYLN